METINSDNAEKNIKVANKCNKTQFLLFVILTLACFSIIGILYYQNVQLKKQVNSLRSTINQLTLSKITPTQIPSATVSAQTELPKVTDRKSTNIDTTNWVKFPNISGYKFKYPATWFISDNNGKVNQIQNWNPKTVERPLPLTGDQSKWDVGFFAESFTTVEEVLSKASREMRVDKIEKSETQKGYTVYFIQGTESFFGNEEERVPVIHAAIIASGQYFMWYGRPSGDDNAEILKQIVETLEK